MIVEHLNILHKNHRTRHLINGLERIGVLTYVLHDFVFYYYKFTQSIIWTYLFQVVIYITEFIDFSMKLFSEKR